MASMEKRNCWYPKDGTFTESEAETKAKELRDQYEKLPDSHYDVRRVKVNDGYRLHDISSYMSEPIAL